MGVKKQTNALCCGPGQLESRAAWKGEMSRRQNDSRQELEAVEHPLDNRESRQRARAYLRGQLEKVEHLDGESEYVGRSSKLPDRRLSFSDQQLARRLQRYTLARVRRGTEP